MSPRPRLPDLTLADAGRTFVMRPGSERFLVVPAHGEPARVVAGAAQLSAVDPGPPDAAGALRRYRLQALGTGTATIACGPARWHVHIQGSSMPSDPPEQTRDDTDPGWGEAPSELSATWWKEQRPPHW